MGRQRNMFKEKKDVIVLELEHGRYFIEHSNEPPESIFDDHKNGTSNWETGVALRDCLFTKKFKPVNYVLEHNGVTKDEFNVILLGYMLEYGIDNVRGGDYDDLVLDYDEKLEAKMKVARQFDKCFNCLGEHRVKRCTETIEVAAELEEFVEELIMGDSSGDEKIDPDDIDEDEKLALRMQMGYEPDFEDIDEDDDERAKWGGLKIIMLVGLFVALFYGLIFFLLKQTGKGRKMKISFKT